MDNNATRIFVGRVHELERMALARDASRPTISIVYGRRRVGKTTLIQRVFGERNLLKFEGIQDRSHAEQREHVLEEISRYFNDPKIAKVQAKTWKEVFLVLNDFISSGSWTVYLEELQWLSNYGSSLISDLKYIWDNYWSHNDQLKLILCGSAPSFIINKVLHSKALHNRSQYEFPIDELTLSDAAEILGPNRSHQEVLDAYLAVGGIPEYLYYLKDYSSVYLSLLHNTFIKGAFFAGEAEKIFVSSLAHKPVYRHIIEYLGRNKRGTKTEILNTLGESSGGTNTEVFQDLQRCHFISYYSPLKLGVETRNSLAYLRDPYLDFYYRFVKPRLLEIERGEYNDNPARAINNTEYRQWLGYAFEKFCLNYNRLISKILGFSAVKYSVGPFYVKSNTRIGQIDLAFKRKDKVITVCEAKYQQVAPGTEVIEPFERKLALLEKFKDYTIEKVLISPNGVSGPLKDSGYFDRIVTLADILTYLKI